MKMKIAKELEHQYTYSVGSSSICKDLKCKCIIRSDDLHSNTGQSENVEKKLTTFEDKLRENEVSNICLVILRFLMLDGKKNRESNLKLLFEEAVNFIDKRRGPDEIMLEVLYPLYERLFGQKYLNLKNQTKYNDPFKYDQIIDHYGKYFIFDENDLCYQDTIGELCNDTLDALSSIWQNLINVMYFDWEMDVGNLISNFNYLLDICVNKKSVPMYFQTDEQYWAVNEERKMGGCRFGKDILGLYRDLEPITETIFNVLFQGVYLNDLIGYLGYSTTFDVTSLKADKYMKTTRDLLPLYGMDQWQDNKEKTWEQCNYEGTYRKWVEYASNNNRSTGMN